MALFVVGLFVSAAFFVCRDESTLDRLGNFLRELPSSFWNEKGGVFSELVETFTRVKLLAFQL